MSSSIRPSCPETARSFPSLLHQGIPLAVAAKADALLEVVERAQVILPLGVDNLKHDVALDTAKKLDTNELFLFYPAFAIVQIASVISSVFCSPSFRFKLLRVDTEHATPHE